MSKPSVDQLAVQKSLIDLSGHSRNSFDSVFVGYDLSDLLDDIILVEFVDEGNDQNTIVRNGILVPVNAATNAWRIGRVILCGGSCKLVKRGDHVCFPNNMGVPIANIEVVNHGPVKHGIFLNEQRIFGVVKPRQNASNINKPKTKGKTGWDGNSVRNMNTLKGGNPDWMCGLGISKKNILQYYYPAEAEMERAGIQIVYLGYFWQDWALVDNANYGVVNGLEVRNEPPQDIGDPYGVTSLDEDWVGMNQMIKYLKFGFGRTTDYVNEQIRRGRMSRAEGVELVELYDGCCGERYITSFCKFIDITVDQFWETVDRSVNKNLFAKDGKGKWVRKFKVGSPCAA